MNNTDTDTQHEYAESRRYVCTSCDSVVRARWSQWGDGYPGYFSVGCDCTIVPVVPEMSQAETPDEWRVERPECCRGIDVKDLEEYYGGVSDYRCPDCDGDLEYPTQADVMCRDCEALFTHEIRGNRHLLWRFTHEDGMTEVVARAE